MSRDTWTLYPCPDCGEATTLDQDLFCDCDTCELLPVRVVSVQALHDWITEERLRHRTFAGIAALATLDALAARFPLTDKENT